MSATLFAKKPPTAALELTELCKAFDRQELASVLDRHPDTVGRMRKRTDIPRKLQEVVDRLWWVMHVACYERQWPMESARYFVVSIEPALRRRPFELIRESDTRASEVVELIKTRPRPEVESPSAPTGTQETQTPMQATDPLTALLAPQPITARDLFGVDPAPGAARGRTLPIGGIDPDDDFQLNLTAADSVVVSLGPLEV